MKSSSINRGQFGCKNDRCWAQCNYRQLHRNTRSRQCHRNINVRAANNRWATASAGAAACLFLLTQPAFSLVEVSQPSQTVDFVLFLCLLPNTHCTQNYSNLIRLMLLEVMNVNDSIASPARPWCTLAGIFDFLTAEKDDTPTPFAVAGQTR